MNSVRSNVSLKYQRFATSGSKDRGIINSEFVANIFFGDTKMVDHILKISRPVFDIYSLSWNTTTIVFIKKYRMDRRRYKSRHWILMFIGTPCMYNVTVTRSYYQFCFNITFSLCLQHKMFIYLKHNIFLINLRGR